MATIPGKNDYTASFFISKGLAYDGVKKAHVSSPRIYASGLSFFTVTPAKANPLPAELSM
jgi:hypothetical protein